jgi:hypothetical protein
MRYLLLCLLLLPVLVEAITPPPPVNPTLASVIIEITPATVRADNVTPFTAAEIRENRLYFTQLPAYIAVAAGVKTYTYIVPSANVFARLMVLRVQPLIQAIWNPKPPLLHA